MIGSGLVAAGMIVSTVISRICSHSWEPTGEQIKVTYCDPFLHEVTIIEYRQPVRCSKCGKYRWFEVG